MTHSLRTLRILALPLFLATFAVAAPVVVARAGDTPRRQEGRQSLQELLARLRHMRDDRFGELRGSVELLLRTMESEGQTRRLEGLNEAKGKLLALGLEAAPLFVDAIDPGEKPTDPVRLRALYVTQAVIEQRSAATTQRVIEIARTGSTEGRLNAVKALAASPDSERASPVLFEIYGNSQGELRRVALAGLAKIGGPENEKRLAQALADGNPDVVRTTLEALTTAHAASFASRVGKLLSVTHDAVQYIDALLGYYRACPEAVDRTTLLSLVRLAEDFSAPNESRIRVLDSLSAFSDRIDNEVKKEVRQIAESPTREIREAALILLVVAGDKSARKDLLADYDGQIERNKTWANSYEARANVLYRIAEYRDAIRDYKEALKLSATDLRARQDEAYIGLARCYMQQNKLKDAATTLQKAPVSLKQLADLAKEPVFQKLVEDKKYGDIFKAK